MEKNENIYFHKLVRCFHEDEKFHQIINEISQIVIEKLKGLNPDKKGEDTRRQKLFNAKKKKILNPEEMEKEIASLK